MLLAVSRVHETVPLFLVEGLKPRLGGSLRDRKVAVLGLTFKRDSDDVRDSLSFKLVRLLERELAHVARHDPHVPDAVGAARGGARGRRRRGRGHQPLRVRGPARAAARAAVARRSLERDRRRARVRRRPTSARSPHEPRARHGRRRHDRRRGGAAADAATPTGRCACPTSARRPPGCARPARSTRATCATRPRRARRSTGCTHVIHLAAIVGGIANFHKLPHTLLEVNNGLYNAVFRAALDARVERLVYVSSSMVFERATEFPTTEEHLPTAPRRARRTASRSWPARSTAARCTTSTGCRTRSAGRSTPTGRASCPTTSRASRTRCPT